jgi:hypothetical protein
MITSSNLGVQLVFLSFFVGISAGVSPAFADSTIWVVCDGDITMLEGNPRNRHFEGWKFGFNSDNHTVVSDGKTIDADFNEIAVGWDIANYAGVDMEAQFSINRSTLELNVQYIHNGKIIGFRSGNCRKSQSPANNQF